MDRFNVLYRDLALVNASSVSISEEAFREYTRLNSTLPRSSQIGYKFTPKSSEIYVTREALLDLAYAANLEDLYIDVLKKFYHHDDVLNGVLNAKAPEFTRVETLHLTESTEARKAATRLVKKAIKHVSDTLGQNGYGNILAQCENTVYKTIFSSLYMESLGASSGDVVSLLLKRDGSPYAKSRPIREHFSRQMEIFVAHVELDVAEALKTNWLLDLLIHHESYTPLIALVETSTRHHAETWLFDKDMDRHILSTNHGFAEAQVLFPKGAQSLCSITKIHDDHKLIEI